MLVSQSFELANEVGLAFTSAVRILVERATGLNTQAHNSGKRYDRPRVATHFYHLYTYTIDIQPENRVLTSQSFGVANEVGLAFTSAVRVPVERATGLNTQAHNSGKRYDRTRVATHFYHLYTYTIDIQPENRVLTSQSFELANEVGLAFTSAVRVLVERATGLNAQAHNSGKRYDRPRVATHFYHLYTYTIDIQPENRVLTSQSFELANEVGLAFTSAVRVPVEHATGLNTGAHNSGKRYDRPRAATHFYHLYTYTIDIQPENRVLTSQSFGLANEVGLAFTSAVRVPVKRATGLNTQAHNSLTSSLRSPPSSAPRRSYGSA